MERNNFLDPPEFNSHQRDYGIYNKNNSNQGYRDRNLNRKWPHPQVRYYPRRDEPRYKKHKRSKKKKKPSRATSPVEGSEEFMNKKIQQTSAIIMRHLLSPEENIISLKSHHSASTSQANAEKESNSKIVPQSSTNTEGQKRNETSYNDKHGKKVRYQVDEIQSKIMNYLSNLNDGRKKNLISTTSSVYDDAIQQIVKQKRLEISRALRNVCLQSSDVSESTELINSIIPDMGIKIEDLPHEILEELQVTFSNPEYFEGDSGCNFFGTVDTRNEEIIQFPVVKEEVDLNFTNEESRPKDVVEILASDVSMNTSMEISDVNSSVLAENTSSLEHPERTEIGPESLGDLNQAGASPNLPNFDHTPCSIDKNPGCSGTQVHLPFISTPNSHKQMENQPQDEAYVSYVEVPNGAFETTNMETCNPQFNIDNEIVSDSSLDDDGRSVEITETSPFPSPLQSDKVSTPAKSKNSINPSEQISIEEFLERNFKKPPRNMGATIKRMRIIDEYIEKLTRYRQQLFIKKPKNQEKNKKKKKKRKTNPLNTSSQEITESVETNPIQDLTKSLATKETNSQAILQFGQINEKILVLKVCEDKLLAATESGKIYFFSLDDGKITNVLNVSTVPISSMVYTKQEQEKPYLFVGSCESSLKVFNLYSTCLLQTIKLDDSVQCMDESWESLFLGCIRGTLLRYSIKKGTLEYEEQFNSSPIFVIKATQEGARRVLLIGSRKSPIIIRDAMSGLHLRTLKVMYPTVYCMDVHKHYIICGTTVDNIPVFNFYNGNLVHTFEATNSVGVGCMKVVGNCLFASCHNGNIYVFNLERRTLEDTLKGPGGVIISMDVFKNQVVVGTLSRKFASLPIAHYILSQMY